MKIAIHQPNYLPYPGFFAKANLCDIFVIYDSAQFTRGDYFNRNRIRTFSLNGCMWLTLPVGKRNYEGVPISEVKIADERIFDKHSQTIRMMYSRAPHFDEDVCKYVRVGHEFLAEHNVFLIKFLLNKLGINPKLIYSSKLNLPIRTGTLGIIDIVKALHGTEYISGLGAKSYMEEEQFKEESINLSYVAYKPLKYPQIHPGFVENMSIIDAVFNIGWKAASLELKNVRSMKGSSTSSIKN